MNMVVSYIAQYFGVRVVSKQILQKYRNADFIPDGKIVDTVTLQFRPTGRFELFQCCQQTGVDIQSGPHYCGRLAEYVAGDESSYVGLCDRHTYGYSARIRLATPLAKDSLLYNR